MPSAVGCSGGPGRRTLSGARALVASTWKADGTEARAGFLPAFAVGLGRDDEPFLEAALATAVRRSGTPPPRSGPAPRVGLRGPDGGAGRRRAGLLRPGRPNHRGGPPRRPGRRRPRPAARAIRRGHPARGVRKGDGPRRDRPQAEPGGPGGKGRVALGDDRPGPPLGLVRGPGGSRPPRWPRPPPSKWDDAIYPGLVEAAVLHRDSDWLDALLPHRRLAGNALQVLAVLNVLPDDRREATLPLSLIRADDSARPGSASVLGRPPDRGADHAPGAGPLRLGPPSVGPGPGAAGAEPVRPMKPFPSCPGGPARLRRPVPPLWPMPWPRRPTPGGACPRSNPDLLQGIDRHLEAFHALIQFRHDMIQELRA